MTLNEIHNNWFLPGNKISGIASHPSSVKANGPVQFMFIKSAIYTYSSYKLDFKIYTDVQDSVIPINVLSAVIKLTYVNEANYVTGAMVMQR
jgi:hypothetical protein